MADNKAPAAAPVAGRPAAAPSTKPESAAAQASRVAPLNLSALTFTDAPAPVRKSSRTKGDNPLVAVLSASWDAVDNRENSPTKGQLYRDFQNGKGAGKAVTVPTSQAQDVVNMIRYAANDLGIGSTIVPTDNPNKTTTINFAAKKRRANHKNDGQSAE